MTIRITKIRIVLALIVAAVVGWIFFHPYRQAQPEELTPTMLDWVRQKPFGLKFDSKARRVILFSKAIARDTTVSRTLEQSFSVVAPGVTRKTTHYYVSGNSSAVQEEYTRLTMGPMNLVSHYRQPLPFVGDLLPYAFWDSRKLRDLVIEKNTGFPDQPDSQFAATWVIDEHFSDGSLSQSASESIQCTGTGIRTASTFLASLKGDAVIYRCNTKSTKGSSYIEESQTENAYFPALAWGFIVNQTMKNNVVDTQVRYENSLKEIE